MCVVDSHLLRVGDSFGEKKRKEGRKEERKQYDFDVVTGMNHGVASFSNWSKFICNPEMFICKRASEDYYLFSKVNTLNISGQAGWQLYDFSKGKSLCSHMVG